MGGSWKKGGSVFTSLKSVLATPHPIDASADAGGGGGELQVLAARLERDQAGDMG